MNTSEVKSRINNFLNNTIDLYMPPTTFVDKMRNSTAKFWLEQNSWRINKAIDAFGDENNEIDQNTLMKYYENILFENGELRLDIKDMLPETMKWLGDLLPNKLILFKKEDLYNIFK